MTIRWNLAKAKSGADATRHQNHSSGKATCWELASLIGYSACVLFGASLHLRQVHSDCYHNFEIRNRGLEDDSLHHAYQYVSALFLLWDSYQGRRFYCGRRGDPQGRAVADAAFAYKIANLQQGDDRFFSLLIDYCDFDDSLLDQEHTIGGIALLEDFLALSELQTLFYNESRREVYPHVGGPFPCSPLRHIARLEISRS